MSRLRAESDVGGRAKGEEAARGESGQANRSHRVCGFLANNILCLLHIHLRTVNRLRILRIGARYLDRRNRRLCLMAGRNRHQRADNSHRNKDSEEADNSMFHVSRFHCVNPKGKLPYVLLFTVSEYPRQERFRTE